jgi:phosphatidylglycerophosphatase A
LKRLAVFVCSFGYIGFFPFAPGTAGSAAGIGVYLILRTAGLLSLELPVIVALYILGVVFTAEAERALGCVDAGPIVIDEVMGMLLTLAFIPVGWFGMLVGFLLFRALDVYKPFPAGRLEHLHGGFGVMSDDAMAAIYANLLLRGAYHVSPHWIS